MEVVQVKFDSAMGRRAMGLRVAVFVEEQGVPAELELDAYDAGAVHFVACEGEGVVETLRVVAMEREEERAAKIGRVAVAAVLRGRGVGRRLMQAAIEYARQNGFEACVLTAQMPVIGFYEKLGFVAHGPVFDEAGIAHRAMRLEFEPA